MLLASVAAFALLTGTGLASAQDQSKDHNGPTQMNQPQTSTPSMNKGAGGATGGQTQLNNGNAGQGAGADKTGQNAQNEIKGAQPKANDRVGESTKMKGMNGQERHAQETNRGQKTSKANAHHNRTTAQRENKNGMERHGGQSNTAQNQGGHNGLKGLQSNASGVNVNLTDQQRTHIRKTVIDARGAPKVGHVNFDVSVGTAIPRGRVHAVRVPETLVRIEPEWRGFLYFVFQDDVVIVNPRDMKIVAVLAV
jgi:hypothetical protein